MAAEPTPKPIPASSAERARVGQAFRKYFVTGVATIFPLAVTAWLLVWIFKTADGIVGQHLGWQIPGLGLLITVAVILLVGILSVHVIGRFILRTLEFWFARLPLVKKIYPPAKQLANFIFNEQSRQAAFRRVVLVQYPRQGAYSMAFVTNESSTAVTGAPRKTLTLLIPNPPSPFTGPIIFVPEEDVIELDLSVEAAVKLIVSGGVVADPLIALRKP